MSARWSIRVAPSPTPDATAAAVRVAFARAVANGWRLLSQSVETDGTTVLFLAHSRIDDAWEGGFAC